MATQVKRTAGRPALFPDQECATLGSSIPTATIKAVKKLAAEKEEALPILVNRALEALLNRHKA